MKIGVNTLFLIPGEVGGSEIYLRETLRAMMALDEKLEWIFFTNRENHSSFEALFPSSPQVQIHRFDFPATNRPLRIWTEQTSLPRVVRRLRPDVLWSPGYTMPLAAVGCPQVLSILDMQYKRYPEDLSWLARWVTDRLIQAGVKRADRVLAISEFSKSEIVTFTGMDAGRIEVTPLGFDSGLRADAKERRKEGKPRVLCIANTYPHKNVETLVRASGRLKDRLPHTLILIGKPRRGEARVRDALKEVGAMDVIRRSGLSRQELIEQIGWADLFVFPSLYEGFGLPVLEAMALGIPVLTTRCGAIPEIGGDAVDYFDPSNPANLAQKIEEVLSRDSVQIHEQEQRARERARRFTWQVTADRTLAAFRTVVA